MKQIVRNELTDTVRQRGLESLLRHTQGNWNKKIFGKLCSHKD